MDSQIISGVIGALSAIAGAAITYLASSNSKKIAKLEGAVEKYKKEIRARQDQEEVVCDWLCELKISSSRSAAKLQLRDKVFSIKGTRPELKPSEVR
jgi:hypothetical protein